MIAESFGRSVLDGQKQTVNGRKVFVGKTAKPLQYACARVNAFDLPAHISSPLGVGVAKAIRYPQSRDRANR